TSSALGSAITTKSARTRAWATSPWGTGQSLSRRRSSAWRTSSARSASAACSRATAAPADRSAIGDNRVSLVFAVRARDGKRACRAVDGFMKGAAGGRKRADAVTSGRALAGRNHRFTLELACDMLFDQDAGRRAL